MEQANGSGSPFVRGHGFLPFDDTVGRYRATIEHVAASLLLESGTFGELTDLVSGTIIGGNAWHAGVQRRAVRLNQFNPGERPTFAIAHGNGPKFFLDLFAVWQLGGCAACLNPGLTPGELENIIGWLRPAAVLVDGSRSDASKVAGVTCLDLEEEAERTNALDPLGAPIVKDAPALILFTSGTTGDPKGVVLSYGAIMARTTLNRAHIPEGALARTLCVLPTHFGHGLIGNCLTPLLGGDALFLYPAADVRSIGQIGSMIDTHRISFMSSVPAFWRIARKVSRPPTAGSLQRVHIGSAPLSAGLWQEVATWAGTDDVVNAYGITETANWVGGISARDHPPEDGLIGRPWGGDIGVRDEGGAIRRRGEGEIVIRSAALFTGYHGRPDLTSAALVDGWYRTGDLGAIDEGGLARLRGREKEEINRAGMKINPAEIDLLLDRHSAVAEACAFSVPDAISGEAVAVCVRWKDGATVSIKDLRGWCATRIRAEAVPEHWYELAEIPKTDRGKTDRRVVRDACLAKSSNP